MILKNFIIIPFIFSLVSCGPATHEQFVARADKIYVSMIKILKQVEDPGDLYKLYQLEPLYLDTAGLLVMAMKKHKQDSQMFNLEIIEAPHQQELCSELMRVYQVEGGQKACEEAAREGLTLLQKVVSPSKKCQSDHKAR